MLIEIDSICQQNQHVDVTIILELIKLTSKRDGEYFKHLTFTDMVLRQDSSQLENIKMPEYKYKLGL